jgi:non-specific serine/threonine protein kinase
MQDMVAWSYDLLAEDEQAFLRLLSVFSGGFTFRAAAAIFGQFGESGDKSLEDLTPDWTGGGGDTFVADLLLSLIDQSLVEQTASDDSQPRFTLLETIREFARERLAENGETDRAFRLYAEWFAALARSRHPDLITTPKGAKHDPLFGEHDNVRAAIAWSIDHHEMQLAGWLACGLWPFCVSNGLYIEAGNVFDRVLSAPEALGPALHADLLHNAARCALLLEDIEKSQSLANSGISLYESLGNRYGAARCLCMIGMAMLRTEPARSASRWAAGVEILREIGETAALAYALDGLGEALIMVGDVEGAKSAASESAAIMHATGNRVSRFSPLGWAAIAEGDFDLAGKILREILEDWQYGPSPHNLADKLRLLGRVEFHCGNLLAAADHFLRALSISYEVDNALECAHCIAGMAAVAQADREPELAARWFGFDERRRQEGRLVLSPDEASARKTASDHALKALGASRFAAAWEAGTKLTMDEACEEVLAWRPSGRATGRPPSVLTRRESQVLTLLALGKTNSDIASELFVSTSTIDTHVSSILGKLGVTSRLAAVREAEKRGMLSE